MVFGRETAVLLLLLRLTAAYGEDPEPTFRSDDGVIELGYCFGVDYIVVYRSGPRGDQLLGNSSSDDTAALPVDLQGRVNITNYQQLLGLLITHLRKSDSGVYRRECWQNRTLANQHRYQLYVCDVEVNSEEIVLTADRGAELSCNSTSGSLEGATIRWYYEVFPSYKAILFLDTAVSPEPLVEGLRGRVEVRDGGASLRVPESMLTSSQQLYCQVMEGERCLSFQNLYLPDRTDVRDVFASEGDSVALACLSGHREQRWDTPLGSINSTAKLLVTADGGASDLMYVAGDDRSGNYSLVITEASEKLSGEYSCFSPSLVASYSLIVCPRQEPKEQLFVEGGEVLLTCKDSPEESHRVQWHRRSASEEDTLILDCADKSLPVPEDLRGRVFLPECSSSLRLTGLAVEDAGAYWCVVLGGHEFLEDDEEYSDNDEEEYNDGDDYSNWSDTYRCISRQVTLLRVAVTPREGKGGVFGPVPGDRKTNPTVIVAPSLDEKMGSDLENDPTAEPSAPSNTTAYALGAVLAVLAVAGAVAAVIAVKVRRQNAAKASGLKAGKETEMRVDPGCTERLNPTERLNLTEEHDA